MTDATPYSIPKEPGRWRALTLALAMHGALVGLLWFSVHWQNATPVAMEAEVWSMDALEAAPPAPEVKSEPAPEPEPEPKPEPVVPPKPEAVEPPKVDPEIALQAEKKRKEKLLKEKQEQEDLAEKKLAEKKKRLEDEKEKKAELAKKEKDAADKKQDEDKKNKQLAAKQQAAQDKIRAEDMKRMLTQAGNGSTTSTGTAAKSQGARGDASYAGKVATKVKSNTIFNVTDSMQNTPPVEYAVELFPDGSVRRPIKKLKSSGIPAFDEAVLNAIEKSQPFPPDKSGSVPNSINIIHRPKDQ